MVIAVQRRPPNQVVAAPGWFWTSGPADIGQEGGPEAHRGAGSADGRSSFFGDPPDPGSVRIMCDVTCQM